MPSYDQNVEAPVAPGQQITTNPQLLNEGYPGISSPQTSFQPPSDGSTLGSGTAPNSQLASLPKEALLGAITQLPQQDLAAFFQGLPQNDQTQINTFIQQNPNAQGSELFNQLAQLPAADLAQGLSLLPAADLQQAMTAAQQGASAGGDASMGTTSGAGVTTDASQTGMQPAYNPGGTAAYSDSSGLATQPGMTTDANGLATQYSAPTDGSMGTQYQTSDTSGLAVQPPAGTDTSGLAVQPTAGTDTSGLAVQNPGMDATGQQAGGTADNSAVLNKLATLSPTELSGVISKLPQQDLATIFQALPADDQQALQQALADNQNPSPQDLATALEKLPARDIVAAASAVPASDFASILSSSDASANPLPKPGGSEFPLILGLAGAGALAYAGYRKGMFDKVPDLFQKLTGRLDEKAPAWMSKFGRGGATIAEDVAMPGAAAVNLAADASVVAPLAEEGIGLGASIVRDTAALATAGSELATVAEVASKAVPAAGILGDAIKVAEVIPK